MNNTNLAIATKPISVKEMGPFSLLIRPVARTNEIVTAWQDYQELKSELLDGNDYQAIREKRYIKKSGWRKLQTAFGISDELMKEERKNYKEHFAYEVTVKVSAQNGRFAFGVGSCSSDERSFAHPDHDVRSTAHTRAKNRAISDLIGGGEVSAEEINVEHAKVEIVPDVVRDYTSSERSSERGVWEENKITDKQASLLRNLIIEKVNEEDEREKQLSEVAMFSRYEASEAISRLLNN